MLVLAVLMLISGLIFTFTLGVAGYIVGPLTIAGGGMLLWKELRRRRDFREVQNYVPRRSSWQRFLIGLSAFVVGFGGLFALVWQLTSVLADTANGFFLALRDGDQAKARTYLAQDFRASTSDEQLQRFVERSALADYESATWTSRSIENSTGKLEGTIETRSGGSIPMSISLVRENGEWKILAVRKPDAGILSDDPRPQPNRADQARLANETTQSFADAVASQDFTQFHESAATCGSARSPRKSCTIRSNRSTRPASTCIDYPEIRRSHRLSSIPMAHSPSPARTRTTTTDSSSAIATSTRESTGSSWASAHTCADEAGHYWSVAGSAGVSGARTSSFRV